MRKIALMLLLLTAASAANADDKYLCDGFKLDDKTKERTAIPNVKFEIEHSILGIEIKNASNNKMWSAYKKVDEGFYQDGNVLLAIDKKTNDTKFMYINTENNQTVVFMNCTVPEEF